MLAKLKKLAAEMIPVILGVLIGLLINGWKENFDEKRYLRKALHAIEQDITYSKADILVMLDSQQIFMDSLAFYMEDKQVSVLDVVMSAGGLKSPSIKNIAISFFVNDRGDLIDYELIAIIAGLEDLKKILDGKVDNLANYIYDHLDETSRAAKFKAQVLLDDVMGTERALVKLYDQYLKQIK